ncbi:hypothetical protein SprV_0100409900 [Sparganum proliferum]
MFKRSQHADDVDTSSARGSTLSDISGLNAPSIRNLGFYLRIRLCSNPQGTHVDAQPRHRCSNSTCLASVDHRYHHLLCRNLCGDDNNSHLCHPLLSTEKPPTPPQPPPSPSQPHFQRCGLGANLFLLRPHIHFTHRPGRSLANPSHRDRPTVVWSTNIHQTPSDQLHTRHTRIHSPHGPIRLHAPP